ncbi:unnamed protein product [Paramecium primaurelia]|uniref:t-SNARE coiled-coil homology domain-containing protein n=1 Tax=Paramecium primaurelia TaxID=5886 RepID=A0A8S1Q4W8_PARPR|nr:unnamed protein product [Paramecium primaurelia]
MKPNTNNKAFNNGFRQNSSNSNVGLMIDQQNSLNYSHRLAEESLQIGEDVLESFKRQNDSLKRIQNKVNYTIGDLGLSQGIIKLIGSRDQQDRRIVIFLTILLFAFIGTLYYVFK